MKHICSSSLDADSFHDEPVNHRKEILADNISPELEKLDYKLYLYSNGAFDEGVIMAKTDIFVIGVFKMNRKQICQQFEQCPEVR